MGDLPGDAAQDDIMQIARVGDIPAMEKLFESSEFDATYTDGEGITPLHVSSLSLTLPRRQYPLFLLTSVTPQWAAINNQFAMCKFLIEKGAEINKKGGESVATPLQWAAQRCHYYTVHLLLQHGADPLITDAQGYNTLHISTFNGNVLLIVLLLHQGIPVDVEDAFGHTGLMWSAYKGFPQCVDLFLRWGASVHATDEQGFTALHWALVKGSPGCVQKIIEYGADRFAKTQTGKTPAITAQELNTAGAWHRALRDSGYDEDGNPHLPSFPGASHFLKDKKAFINRFLFLWPFLVVWAMLVILAGMPVYAGVPFSLIVGYGLQWVAQQVLIYAPPDMRSLQRTVRTEPPHISHAPTLTPLGSLGCRGSLQARSFLSGSAGCLRSSRKHPSLQVRVSRHMCDYVDQYSLADILSRPVTCALAAKLGVCRPVWLHDILLHDMHGV